MKLNNIIRKTTKLLLTLAVVVSSLISVSASTTAPKSINISHSTYKEVPVRPLEDYHIKYITDTKDYVYCLTYAKKTPNGINFTLGNKITDAGMDYILAKGANNKTELEYYITQTALWIYMMDEGITKYSNSVNHLKTEINKNTDSTSVAIKNLVNEAKAKTSIDKTLTLSTNTNTLTFTLNSDKSYYISNIVKVTSNSTYKVTINSAPANTVTENVSDGFVIKVPVSSLNNLTNNVSISVSSTKTIYNSYEYNPSNDKYQVMSYTVPETLSKQVSLAGTIKTTQVSISKIDAATSEELPGAKLKLVCNNGSYVKEWISSTKPLVLTDVPEGTCSLTETQAPEEYELSTETITFTVVAGKVTAKQVMKNTRKTYEVEISKVDAATSKELAGAKLQITNKDGEVVCSWISDGTTHTCKNLKAGTYTLTETQAPDGYVLSTETIEFEVGEGKVVEKIVMENTKQTFNVKISKIDITDSKELKGAKLQITNKEGNVVCSWTSNGKVHTCKNLKAGTYTLTEITAPDGYEVAESITFEIDVNGTLSQNGEVVDKITMVDKPIPTIIEEVPDTLSTKNTISYIIGLGIILSGVGIIVRLTKKNEQ